MACPIAFAALSSAFLILSAQTVHILVLDSLITVTTMASASDNCILAFRAVFLVLGSASPCIFLIAESTRHPPLGPTFDSLRLAEASSFASGRRWALEVHLTRVTAGQGRFAPLGDHFHGLYELVWGKNLVWETCFSLKFSARSL